MEDSIEHRLSALLDGETSEFETRRLIGEINKNPEIKDLWIRMNKTKSLLTAEIDFSPRNIASTVMEELDASDIKQIKFSKDEKSKHSQSSYLPSKQYLKVMSKVSSSKPRNEYLHLETLAFLEEFL